MLRWCRVSLSLASADPLDVASFEGMLRRDLRDVRTIEAASQIFARGLYETFANCVLARVYLTLPFGQLPDDNKRAVQTLASAQGGFARLNDQTVVLSLTGTWGKEPAWRQRRMSKNHLGIPLLDPSFVASIPMVARLFEELGVGLDGLPAGRDDTARKLMGGFNGVFYVADAATTLDSRGRHIIPAQDFVSGYGVKTVFGMGGAYLGGTLAACIVFSGETIPRRQAENFASLITPFKAATSPLLRGRQIFEPDSANA